MKSIEEIYQLYQDCGQTVCTDTRKIIKDSLFFALKGDNFNGNLFAEKALEMGAKYAIVDEESGKDSQIIIVENVLKTLQQLANYHRKQCKAKILGIGGSNGKTTTKELLNAVLSTQYIVQSTKGNFNNHIGVPLTLLELKEECEIAIVELGANHIGDIAELCVIAEPDLGIITNIGKEHLEGFGSLEGVAQAESELFDFLLKHEGFAFVNADDEWLNNMSKRISKKISYSIRDKDTPIYIPVERLTPTIQFTYNTIEMKSALMGEHNLQNIAATIAIASYFKVKESHIASGIGNYKPQNNRSQIIETANNNTILLDAYNANPSSVESTIRTFREMADKPRLMIIGDMFELGKYAAAEHLAIAELCAQDSQAESILVGQDFYNTNYTSPQIKIFRDKNEAMEFVRHQSIKNQNVLIKGSRGMKMEDFKDLL